MKTTKTGQIALAAGALGALGGMAAGTARADATFDTPLTQAAHSSVQTGTIRVIARLNGTLTPAQGARIAALGAHVTQDLAIIHSLALTLPTRNLKAFAALPFVTHLSSDGPVKKYDEFTVGSSGASVAWQAPYKVTGQGVTVAVIDSGLNAGAKDLATPPSSVLGLLGLTLKGPRVLAQVSFAYDAKGKMLDPNDQCGHGTHVAGIVAGNGTASTGRQYTHTFYGTAPMANLVNVRVLDAQGSGSVSSVVSGIQWVLVNQSRYKIKVINLSLGHPVGESYTTDPLCQAVEAAWQSGITVVCAAGNDGRLDSVQDQPDNEGWGTDYGTIASPGDDPYVITVGATKSTDGSRADDRIATYSSRGPSRLDLIMKPDIVAPGNRVISLDAHNSTLDMANNGANQLPKIAYQSNGDSKDTSHDYFVLSGTSMATPVVAGAAALLLQANPTLSPDTIKARLMLSADKPDSWLTADGSYDPLTYGAGYLNIAMALQNTFTVSGEYAISPSLSVDDSGNVTVNNDHAVWGKTTVDSSHAVWGKSALWGANGITDLHAVWGKSALWGSSTLSASHAVWGKSVWSDHAIWGTNTDGVDLSSVVLDGE